MNHKGTKVLETKRLILRRFRVEDAQEMFDHWASDEEVTRYLTWLPHENVEVTKAILQEWEEGYKDLDFYHWGIILKETGELIGDVSVTKITDRVKTATLGWCMGQAWWGKGYMPEAGNAILKYCFEEIGVLRVEAAHDINNPKSGRVMEKIGMVKEGILRQRGFSNQGIIDEVWYGILKDEYDGRNEA